MTLSMLVFTGGVRERTGIRPLSGRGGEVIAHSLAWLDKRSPGPFFCGASFRCPRSLRPSGALQEPIRLRPTTGELPYPIPRSEL